MILEAAKQLPQLPGRPATPVIKVEFKQLILMNLTFPLRPQHHGLFIMPVQVSVILPTYNRSHSLVAACTSVLTQSFKDLELIVVDDGSVEDVGSLVRSIPDERVKFIKREKNGGAAAARNTGLAEAKGEYIAFQDSDDLWLPNKLERQVKLLSKQPQSVGAVTGGKILYGRDDNYGYGSGKVAYAPPQAGRLRLDEDQLVKILTENRLSLQNALFRKDCYPDRQWFDPRAKANEDWDFAIRLLQRTKIFEDAEPVVLGFISADSISSNFRRGIIGRLRIMKKNKEVLAAHKKQLSLMLWEIGRVLREAGKPKLARPFILSSIVNYPQHAVPLLLAILKRIFRAPLRLLTQRT